MYKLIALAILLVFISCKKNGEQTGSTTEVKVREYGTLEPVANAAVVLKRSGLNGILTLFTGYTNDNGICLVPTKYYNEPGAYMEVSSAKHWKPIFSSVGADVILHPVGWIRVYGIQTPIHVYPGASFIKLYAAAQTFGLIETNGDKIYPVDTHSIVVRAFAGQPNSIVWHVLNSNSDTLNHGEEHDIMVPKFDTIDIVHLAGY